MTGPSAEEEAVHRGGVRFWATAAVGWAVIAVSVRGIVVDRVDTRPLDLARFVIGGALVHDLVVVPLALVAAALLARGVGGRARAPVQAAVVVATVLALYAYPLVRGFGRAAGNPTSLPHDYRANLVAVVLVVWAVIALVALASVAATGRYGHHERRDDKQDVQRDEEKEVSA